MKRRETAVRGGRGLPGSSRGDGALLDRSLVETAWAEAPGEGSKLLELRDKIHDRGYVDGAIGRIASFLSSRYRKDMSDE